MSALGRFYGIGVGPGDPELLTLKARRILSEVPIIFVPKKGQGSASYASSIIAGLVSPQQEIIELVFPMVREREQLEDYWQKAVVTIWGYLSKGKDCAFINLGDPLLFGTFIPVLGILRREHPEVEVHSVPGISSISAAAAQALLPLATEDDRVAIISGRCEDKAIRETLNSFDTVIFMKVNAIFDHLMGILEELNLVDKCVYVKKCTTRDEEIVRDITRLKGDKLDYFSLLIFRR
ncbi:MAG: precorrin-2 C(20)-methyltransferase [Dehalococcoidales bacterium]|nr:precorrin-2 C(20)-methyltransferase [Dehalococcoidales bacterium]